MDSFFHENMAPAWELFVVTENKSSEEATKARMSKRKEKLKLLMSQEASISQALARNEIILGQWQANIYDIEHVRFLKTVQDTSDHAVFVDSTWNRLLRQITRERAILDPQIERKWRLDMTEGRSRMRKKLIPDIRVRSEEYQPKGSSMAPPVRTVSTTAVTAPIELGIEDSEAEQQSGAEELDFEVVDPDEPSAIEEDKNRKVLRSLEHGDTVVDVFNVSRIVGLDAHGHSRFVDVLIIRGFAYSWEGKYLPHRSLLPAVGSGNRGRMGCANGGT
jgi:beige protein homolog 1